MNEDSSMSTSEVNAAAKKAAKEATEEAARWCGLGCGRKCACAYLIQAARLGRLDEWNGRCAYEK